MKLNLEQRAILEAAENGNLETIAAEKARRNERGFTFGWTADQHLARFQAQVAEWKAEMVKEAQQNIRPSATFQSRRPMPGTADYDLFVNHGE